MIKPTHLFVLFIYCLTSSAITTN